jgi:hypothetical protein
MLRASKFQDTVELHLFLLVQVPGGLGGAGRPERGLHRLSKVGGRRIELLPMAERERSSHLEPFCGQKRNICSTMQAIHSKVTAITNLREQKDTHIEQ